MDHVGERISAAGIQEESLLYHCPHLLDHDLYSPGLLKVKHTSESNLDGWDPNCWCFTLT